MATISLTAEELTGRELLDETGRKDIGAITDLYVDDDGRPHWLLVETSFFPGFFSVIPVTDVVVSDRGLEVHYDMEKLTGAPNNMKGKDYAAHREGRLYDYYGLEAPDVGRRGDAPRRRVTRCCCRRARSAASRRCPARTSRRSSTPASRAVRRGGRPGVIVGRRLAAWAALGRHSGLKTR